MPTSISQNWKVNVYKGPYSGFNYDVLAVEIESVFIPEARLAFLYQDLNLNFAKKIKPFMANVSLVSSSDESDLKNEVSLIIEKWKSYKKLKEIEKNKELKEGEESKESEELKENEESKKSEESKEETIKKPDNFFDLSSDDESERGDKYRSIDEVLGGFIPNDEIDDYYENIKTFVKNNLTLFAERGSLKISDEDADKDNVKNNIFDKSMHLGAFLVDEQYRVQYEVCNKDKTYASDDEDKMNGKYPLAIKLDQFKNIADINLEQYQVKDVIQAFITKKYILRGNSKTVEKDLTLSPKTQVRCLVLDIGK